MHGRSVPRAVRRPRRGRAAAPSRAAHDGPAAGIRARARPRLGEVADRRGVLHDDAYLVAAPPADGVVAERRVAPPRSTQLPEVRTMSNSLPFPVPPAAYTLRVRAVDTDHEVPVRGAVLMSGHRPSVMLVDQLTPFELSAPGPMVSGILQTIDEDDDAGLHVELLRHGGRDRHDRVVMAASARTVLLGEGVIQQVPRFIRGA